MMLGERGEEVAAVAGVGEEVASGILKPGEGVVCLGLVSQLNNRSQKLATGY